MVEKVTTEKGKLNCGYFHKQQQKRNNTTILLCSIGYWILLGFSIMFDLNLLLMIIAGGVMVFCILTLVATKNNVLINTLNEFYDTLDYEACEKKIIELYKQPLHSESRKQLMLHQVNLLLVIDLKRACEIFDLIEKPTLKSNIGLYKTIELLIKINKNENDNLLETINQLEKEHTDFFNKQSVKTLKRTYEIQFTQNEIIDIEKNINKSMKKFIKILDYNNLMIYYNVRNNIEKAKEYANKILEFNTNFHELNKQAKNILNK